MFLDVFAFWKIFSLTPRPTPSPTSLTPSAGYKVRGQRSFLFMRGAVGMDGGGGVGCVFRFILILQRKSEWSGPGDGLATYTHTLQWFYIFKRKKWLVQVSRKIEKRRVKDQNLMVQFWFWFWMEWSINSLLGGKRDKQGHPVMALWMLILKQV